MNPSIDDDAARARRPGLDCDYVAPADCWFRGTPQCCQYGKDNAATRAPSGPRAASTVAKDSVLVAAACDLSAAAAHGDVASPAGATRRIDVEWLTDEHECDDCGTSHASGARVLLDGEEILELLPVARCFDGEDWSAAEVFRETLARLGYEVRDREEDERGDDDAGT
jgi:hypothetical protein